MLLFILDLEGCAGLTPGHSSRETEYFAEPPVVVHRGEDYFLSWTQGTYPFFFQPSYEAHNGRLVFAIGGCAGELEACRRGGWSSGQVSEEVGHRVAREARPAVIVAVRRVVAFVVV